MGVMSGSGVEIHPLNADDRQEVTGFFVLNEIATESDVKLAADQVLSHVTGELEKLYAIYNHILTEPETKILEDQDWETSWQQFFSTTEIVPGLVIKPSWEEFSPSANQRVIKMDPGMAFGTGQHASTRLALSLISSCFDTNHDSKPSRVLDVGTGTGILAMAAAVYGADQIMAIDNDPEAVTVASHNVNVNHFDWNVGISTRPLDDLEGPYDLICANIIHDVLVDMAPIITRLAAQNSHIILAGILNGKQEENIATVYQDNGMHLVRAEHDDEWAALLLEKSS